MPKIDKAEMRWIATGSRLCLAVFGAFLSGSALAWPSAAAEVVVVQDDATPVVSSPAVGGHIVAFADAGSQLVVLDREGEWLKVSGSQFGSAGRDVWVPAARVSVALSEDRQNVVVQTGVTSTEAPFRMVTGAAPAPDLGMPATVGSNSQQTISDGRSVFRVTTTTNTVTNAGPTTNTPLNVETQGASATGGVQSFQGVPALNQPAAGSTTVQSTTVVTTQSSASAAPASPSTTVPAAGNPTPSISDPMSTIDGSPAKFGNPVPALGNPVPSFGGTSAAGFAPTAIR